MKARTDNWYPYLDALRITLSVAVVLYHYFWHGVAGGGTNITAQPVEQFHLLSYAVQLFFIISGFVIAGSMKNRSAIDFLIARVTRLGPTLIICGTITFLLVNSITTSPPVKAPILGYLYTVTLIPLVRALGIDPSLWSITYELRFYALAGMILWFWKSTAAAKLLFSVACLDILPLIWGGAGGFMDAQLLSMNTGFKIYGCFFAMGMIIYSIKHERKASPLNIFVFTLLFISCSIRTNQDFAKIHESLTLPHTFEIFSQTGFFLNLAGISLFIVCITTRPPTNSNIVEFLRILGRASFPLYVLHQAAGFWLINLINTQAAVDARIFAILLFLSIAVIISEKIEPSVRKIYTRLIRVITPKAAPVG